MDPAVDSAPHCERDDSPENCVIEITEEMIDAGVSAFWDYDYRFNNERDVVANIFESMYRKHLRLGRVG